MVPCCWLQTSHVTPQQAGTIFTAAAPRLAVAHHLTVNAASRAAIIQDIRAGYPKVNMHPRPQHGHIMEWAWERLPL
jgi:hypothetical protein